MTIPRILAIACALPVLASCALFRSNQPGPGRVQEFVTTVERVHVEAELARERAASAVRALQIFAGGDFGQAGAVTAYEQLMQAIGGSEGQADVLANATASMHAAAEPMFEHWSTDLQAIADPALRQRGAQRLQSARERYRSIGDSIDPSIAAYRQLNQRLRDYALFLGHDLNPAALADARPGIELAANDARTLQAGFDTALAAARSYLEVASLPVGSPAQSPAQPAAQSPAQPPARAVPATPAAPAVEPATEPRPARQPVRLDGQRNGNR